MLEFFIHVFVYGWMAIMVFISLSELFNGIFRRW